MAGRERESSSNVGPRENQEDDYRDADKWQQFGTVGLHLVLSHSKSISCMSPNPISPSQAAVRLSANAIRAAGQNGSFLPDALRCTFDTGLPPNTKRQLVLPELVLRRCDEGHKRPPLKMTCRSIADRGTCFCGHRLISGCGVSQGYPSDTVAVRAGRVWIHGPPAKNLVRLGRPYCAADHILSMVINKFSTARRCNLLISRIPLDEFAVRALIHVVANIFGAFGKRGHAFRATTTPFAGFKILPCPLWVTPMRWLTVNSCFGL
jgi:hypothetical protein